MNVAEFLCRIDVLDVFDSFGAIRECVHHFVVGGDGRVCDVFVLELYRIAEPVTACRFYMASVCSIVLRRRG